MESTVHELAGLLQHHGKFLAAADEALTDRQYHLAYSRLDIPGTLDLPLSLQTASTRVIESFNADWSSLKELDGSVVASLNELSEVFENIYRSHAAALSLFGAASKKKQPYTLYLRSFSQVTNEVYAGEAGRVVAFINDERLDRNVAAALARHAAEIHPVTCAHTDDMALLEGRWLLPAFRVHDHTWRNVVRAAIRGSSVIVFYLGNESKGVRFELDEIASARLAARTILLYAGKHAPDADEYNGFAAVLPISQAVQRIGKKKEFRLSKYMLAIVRRIRRVRHPTPHMPAWLMDLPCGVVDPKVPEEIASRYDLAHSFFVTPSNITALYWYAYGFPQAMEIWNRIARALFREKRAPSRADLDTLQADLIMASTGAAALGLVASLACITALRTMFAALIVEPHGKRRASRKERFLQLFDIAARLDALTERHTWRSQIAKWRQLIVEDTLPLP